LAPRRTPARSILDNKSRVSTLIWVLIIPMIIGFFALSNIDNEIQFRTLNVFFILYLASGFGIFLAMANVFNIADSAKKLSVFWTNDIDSKGLTWILIGIVGVFASVGLTLTIASGASADGILIAQVTGIGLAGVVMMVTFLQTNALLVPIFVHGFYNSVVVFLRVTGFDVVGGTNQFSIAEGSKLFLSVNEIGIGLGQTADLISEVIWQFTLVATAEEFLKLGILVVVVLIIHGRFQDRGLAIFAGIKHKSVPILSSVNKNPNPKAIKIVPILIKINEFLMFFCLFPMIYITL